MCSRISPESTLGKKLRPRNGARPKERTTQARNPTMNPRGLASASERSDR
jgi:hypothetical protein